MWRASFAISFMGALQLIVCIVIAMTLYSGGNFRDHSAPRYRPGQNFTSDLGRSISVSGRPNRSASRVFNISLTLFALSVLPFYLFMPMQARDRPWSLIASAVLGAMASVALMVMAAHPADLYPAMHHIALFAWALLLFLSTSIHGIAMLTSNENKALVMPLISIGVAMLAIAWCIQFGETAAAFAFHRRDIPLRAAFLEKFVFIGMMTWFIAFSIRALVTTDFSEYRQKQRDIDAETYLGQIGLRHLDE